MRKSCRFVLVLLSMALVVAFTNAPTAFAEPKFKLNVGAGNDKKDKDKDKDDDNKNNNSNNGNNNNNSNGNNSNNNSNGNNNSNNGKSNNSNGNGNNGSNSNNKQNNSNDNKNNGNSNSNSNNNNLNNSNSNNPKQPQSIQDFLKSKNGQNQGNNNPGNNNQGNNNQGQNNNNKFNPNKQFPGQVLQNPNQVQNQNQNQNPNFKFQDNDKKNSVKFGVWNGDKWQGSHKAENWNKVFGHNQKLFSKQWYDEHPHAWHWDDHNHNHKANVWVVASVPGMYQWLGWGDAPAQYRVGYNPGYRVDFSDYGDWYPMGVYSLMTGPDDMGTRVVQLAVDRHGHLNGTYYDMITDNSYQISGEIQQQSQRAFWNLDKNPNVRFNAALFRLLQPEGSINVDLPGGQQRWQFVRLENDQQ